MQTVWTLIRCCILRRLIWVHTVCLCPKNVSLSTQGSKVIEKINFLSICSFRLPVQTSVSTLAQSSPYELQHDKTNKMSVRSAKTQISLGIRPVWSVFAARMKKPWVLIYLLSTQRRPDQTGRMPRLIWVFARCTLSVCWFCHVVAHMR